MTHVPIRGCQSDQKARAFLPLWGRQGARLDAPTAAKERPADTIAVARGLAEGPA